MKKKYIHVFLLCALLSVSLVAPPTQSFAKTKLDPNVESTRTPDTIRTSPIPTAEPPRMQSLLAPSLNTTTTFSLQAVTAPTIGPNLIQNGSLENGSSTPDGWQTDTWLTNKANFLYPVTGVNGSRAIQVSITSYSSGDSKWYFDDVPVTAGDTYQFSDYSKANVPSNITAQFKMSDGSYTYKYIGTVSASTDFKQNTYQIVIPQNAVAITVFHVIQQVGILATDEFSLNHLTSTDTTPTPTTTPPTAGNLISNGDFETANGSVPSGWSKDIWLNNNAVFTYPATGVSGSKAAKVSITSYSSGDAKWYFNPISVSAGTYTFTEQYQSSVPTNITVEFQNNDGSYSYKWLTSPPSANSFTPLSLDFQVGSNVAKVTVFHSLTSAGTLTIDNVGLVSKTGTPPPTSTTTPSNIFSTGAVSLTFDDAWLSQYQNAIPKLNSAGLVATFYIVSRQLSDYGFTGFLSIAQVKQLYSMGEEIGAHTQTHEHLTQLSPADQQTEIQGSRDDLLAMNIGPINTFAYPYGEYDSTVLQEVKDAGFTAARTTIRGYNTPTTDKYQLIEQSVEVTTTLSQVKSWVDSAIANKQWLIINFHRVDTSGDQYSVSPTTFGQIVDYLVSKNVKVIKMSDGVSAMNQ